MQKSRFCGLKLVPAWFKVCQWTVLVHLHYPISAVHAGIWRFRKQLWRQDLPAARPESDTDSCIRSTGTGFPQTDDRVHFLCGGSSTSTLQCFSASWWSDHVKTLTDSRAFNTASSSSTDQLSLVLANNNTSSFVSYFLIINLTLSNKCSSVKDTGFPSEMCQDVQTTEIQSDISRNEQKIKIQ